MTSCRFEHCTPHPFLAQLSADSVSSVSLLLLTSSMLLDKNNVVLKRTITIRAQLREENGTVQLDGIDRQYRCSAENR